MKVQKGEVVFDAHYRNPVKARKWIVAIKRTLPVTSTVVYKNSYAERAFKNLLRTRFQRGRFRGKRRKKKKWQIQAKKTRIEYEHPEDFLDNILDMPAFLEFQPKHLRRHGRPTIFRIKWMWRDGVLRRVWRRAIDFPPRRRAAAPYAWKPRFYRTSFENATGGGRQRDIVGRRIAMMRYVRRMVASFTAPDEDGYYGRYK